MVPHHFLFFIFLVIFMPSSIPTLGITGWINDFAAVADYLLSCYITTNSADSILHAEQNTSMQYTLKEFAGEMYLIEERMHDDLLAKFQVIFGDSAEVTVEVEAEDETKPDQYTIRFTGTVYDGAQAFVVGRLVQYENGRVINISKINNG